MHLKYNTIISILFTVLATWVIFAAIPYFRLNGIYPQIDTQVIFLHLLCGIMFFYFSSLLYFNKYNLEQLKHPLIFIPFLIAIFGLVASLFNKNPNISFSGSPQIGQGVFWYFDLTIMSIIFSQTMLIKKLRLYIFINVIFITSFITFFTFFPHWRGLPISFYYFTDYLCFYGVLCFILLTTLTNKIYLNISGFFILGLYLSLLDNRAAIVFWLTTLLAALLYYFFNLFKKNNLIDQLKCFLFSNGMFVFLIFFISFLILFCSIYFWSENYTLSPDIKGTLLDAPVVRGKIIETSLYSLLNFKNIIFGNGWGAVPDLLLENMKNWQYDELRVGYNLHFHTHNELTEHLVSLGLIGGILFLVYLYFIFKESSKFSFAAKLGWLLFFKINSFWFLWTGTFTVFAVVVSCFITYNNLLIKKNTIFHNIKFNRLYLSFLTVPISLFLFYGAFITYQSTKVNKFLNYNAIIENIKGNENSTKMECLNFYEDYQRGGFILDRFLSMYSSNVMAYNVEDIDEEALIVLNEIKCKANKLIETKNFTSSLLATAMKADTDYYFKFKDIDNRKDLIIKNYDKWLYKAHIISETIPNRGDLLLPFLSYAVNNNKMDDAVEICNKNILGIEAFCNLIKASNLLNTSSLDNAKIKKSIKFIKKAINQGLFDELVYGFWYGKCIEGRKVFCNYGIKGIPLSPDIIFLISNQEKLQLERIIN